MPLPVQIRRVAEQYIRRLGLQGHLGLTLLDDVQPTIDLFGDGYEGHFSRGERPFVANLAVSAVAAQFGSVGLYIPPAVRIFTTVERIDVTLTPVRIFLISPASLVVDSGAPFANGRDGRLARNATGYAMVPGTRIGNRNNAAALVPNLAPTITAPATVEQPWILTPDTVLMVEATTVNVAFSAQFWGYEWNPAPQEEVGG